MKSLKPDALGLGDCFYECDSGFNIKAIVTKSPEKEPSDPGEPDFWVWEAENFFTGEKISYRWCEKFSHYGPRIYSDPQYVTIVERKNLWPGEAEQEHVFQIDKETDTWLTVRCVGQPETYYAN